MRRAALLALLALSCSGSLDGWGEDGSADGDSDADADAGSDSDADAPPVSCEGIRCPTGYRCESGLCFPIDPCAEVVCSTPGEVCSGGICVAGEGDLDGDGVRARDDCDDTDPEVYPGATETCNAVDDDCDHEVDEGFDADGDGYTVCGGPTGEDADCDDDDPAVSPEAVEVCDGGDDDCDGEVDEGLAARACTRTCGSGVEQCLGGAWVCDAPETGECAPASVDTDPCGRCGSMSHTCLPSCIWGSWSVCSGEGVCSAGETRSTSCPGSCMVEVCSSTCAWSEGCTTCSPSCSGFTQCGTSCPSGYHPSRWYCDSGCTSGSCISASDNAARCDPSCGASFAQCGTSCPSGYHASRWYCTTDCTSASSCISMGDNAATCGRDEGSSFSACGSTCPPGYAVSRTYCTTDCTSASSCISMGDNAVTCTRI